MRRGRCGAGIERSKLLAQWAAWLGNIRLAQQQCISQCDLPTRFRVALQRCLAVHHIDDGDDTVDRVKLGKVTVGHQRVQDGCGIGEAGSFNQHPVIGDLTRCAPTLQVEQGGNKVASYGAAQAAGGQREQCLVAAGDQLVIQTDFAEFIDDDGRAGEGRVAQNAGDQRGLATAEKAGDDGDRNCGLRRQWTALC